MPKKKRWTDEEMINAIDLVKSGESIRKASKVYGVPRTTMRDRLILGDPKKPGSKTLLTIHEEEQLVKYVKYMSRTGNPVTVNWICETAVRLMACRYMFCTYCEQKSTKNI